MGPVVPPLKSSLQCSSLEESIEEGSCTARLLPVVPQLKFSLSCSSLGESIEEGSCTARLLPVVPHLKSSLSRLSLQESVGGGGTAPVRIGSVLRRGPSAVSAQVHA